MHIRYKILSFISLNHISVTQKSAHWYSYWIYLIKKGSKQHINSLEIDGIPYSNPLKRKKNGTYKIRYNQWKSFITKRSCITNLCHHRCSLLQILPTPSRNCNLLQRLLLCALLYLLCALENKQNKDS